MTSKKFNKPANPLHTSQVRVRFYDTDLTTTAFFTNHIKWFESDAIIDFFRERGIPWTDLMQRNLDVAIATVSFDYLAPAFLDDLLDVTVEKVECGTKSVRFEGGIYKQETGEPIGRGNLVYVFLAGDTRQTIPVPEDIRKKLS